MKKKYIASIIGLLFSLGGFISTFTFVLPILTLIPSLILEYLFSLFFGENTYKYIGISVIVTLIFTIFISSYFLLKTITRQPEKINKELIFYFLVLYFVIPPTFFFVNTSGNWDKASDGQFFLGIFETFPESCVSFFFIGIFIDLYRIIKVNTTEKK